MTSPTALVEYQPPDIQPYRHGNTGTEFVTAIDSGEPGPSVVINGLTHGNELCGAVAIDTLFRRHIRPVRGRLTLSLANVGAFRTFSTLRPYASRFLDEDMNRVWSAEALESERNSAELARARALRPVFEAADIVLDLHSMACPGEPMILCGATERGRKLALSLGFPRWVVADNGHPSGRRLIDFEPFAASGGAKIALLVECGPHWHTRTAENAIEVSLRLLHALEMLRPEDACGPRPPRGPESPRVIEVTHTIVVGTDRFLLADDFDAIEVLPRAGTVIARDDATVIRTPYDDCVLILPSPRGLRGHVAVRLGRFADGGSAASLER